VRNERKVLNLFLAGLQPARKMMYGGTPLPANAGSPIMVQQ